MNKSNWMLLIIASIFIISCDEEESIQRYNLILSESNSDQVYAYPKNSGVKQIEIKVIVNSSNADRIYITKSAIPFEMGEMPDGSINISTSTNPLGVISVELPIPTWGDVQYFFWATNGIGNYRDRSMNSVTKIGSVYINDGSTYVPLDDSFFKSYNPTLQAPKADGTSYSFTSTLNGIEFNITDREEQSYFWDIGYKFDDLNGISFYSPYVYPKNTIDIVSVSDANSDDLNKTFFTYRPDIDYDRIDEFIYGFIKEEDINFITTELSNQFVTNLKAGDVFEFLDSYGKKGFIGVEYELGGQEPNYQQKVRLRMLVKKN